MLCSMYCVSVLAVMLQRSVVTGVFTSCVGLCMLQDSNEVKESRNRPDVAQRVPGGLGSQIPMTFGTFRW